MPDPITPPADPATPPAGATPPSDPPPADPPADPAADPGALGDAGKKALDAMKTERNKFRDDLKAIRDEFDSFKAKAGGKEAEHLAAQAAQKVRDEALAAANERILKAEVRAAAAAKLNDPQDALRFLDMSQFEVGQDGEVDASQVAQAIDDLLTSKPYLGAQGGQRFQGSADGGARNGSQTSLDDQIADATKAGNHQLAIALKQQRSAELLAKKS